MFKEYIKKQVTGATGHDNMCSVVTEISIDTMANAGYIRLKLYKDFDAKERGLPEDGNKIIAIKDLTAMPSFSAVHADIMNMILTDEQYAGATLETVEVPDPVIEESESGIPE